jgi:hypothetical protein
VAITAKATSLKGGNLTAAAFNQSGGGGAPANAFLQATEDASDSSPYTFSAQNLGTAHAQRVIVVCAYGQNPTSWTSITLDGNAMTEHNTQRRCTIRSLAWPTGTTGTIVCTVAGATIQSMGIGVWAIYPSSATVLDADGTQAVGTTITVSDVQIATGGILIVTGRHQNTTSGNTLTWTGADTLTERYDEQIGDGDSTAVGADVLTCTESSTTLDLTMTWTGAAQADLCAASWSP